MLRKLLLLMFAFAVTIMAQAKSEYSTLVVETKSGTKLELSLKDKPKVNIGSKEFTIHCGDDVTSYVHEEVRKFYFIPYTATSIEAPVAKNTIRVSMIDQSKVVVSGISDAGKVRLYTLDGKAVAIEASSNDDELIIDWDALTPGTYILNIDNKQTFKLLKR